MTKKIDEREIREASLKFVKERFGCHNLKVGEERGIDLKSHRISFEVGVSMFLQKAGYTKVNKSYIIKGE